MRMDGFAYSIYEKGYRPVVKISHDARDAPNHPLHHCRSGGLPWDKLTL